MTKDIRRERARLRTSPLYARVSSVHPIFLSSRATPAAAATTHARTPAQKFIRGIWYFWWVVRAGINHTRGPAEAFCRHAELLSPVHARSIRFIAIPKERGWPRDTTPPAGGIAGRSVTGDTAASGQRNRIVGSVYRRGRNGGRRLNAWTWSELKPFVDIEQISLRTRPSPLACSPAPSRHRRGPVYIYQKHRGDLRSFSLPSDRLNLTGIRGRSSVDRPPSYPYLLHVDWN